MVDRQHTYIRQHTALLPSTDMVDRQHTALLPFPRPEEQYSCSTFDPFRHSTSYKLHTCSNSDPLHHSFAKYSIDHALERRVAAQHCTLKFAELMVYAPFDRLLAILDGVKQLRGCAAVVCPKEKSVKRAAG